MNALRLRLSTINNRNKSLGERAFAIAELICFPISFLTFAFVLSDFVGRFFGLDMVGSIPSEWLRKSLSVLIAAAIGYVTNWLAIMMLFRPYENRRWLLVWQQGLIPRNKPKMAKEIGHQVGTKLLSPDKLVDEFCVKIRSYMSRPDVIRTLRQEMQQMLVKHEKEIADFLVPQIERSVFGIIDNYLTPEQFQSFWQNILQPKLGDPETRAILAQNIVKVISEYAPELVDAIRDKLRQHLDARMPVPLLTEFVMEFFADERSIRAMIDDWLASNETHDMLRDKLLVAGDRIGEWIRSDVGHHKLAGFISGELNSRARTMVSAFVQKALPDMISEACSSEKVWNWVEFSLLPAAKNRMVEFIVANKQKILDDLRISERVEEAINRQSVQEFHEMLDRLAAQHLSAIQVLGYLLGGIVGLLQR